MPAPESTTPGARFSAADNHAPSPQGMGADYRTVTASPLLVRRAGCGHLFRRVRAPLGELPRRTREAPRARLAPARSRCRRRRRRRCARPSPPARASRRRSRPRPAVPSRTLRARQAPTSSAGSSARSPVTPVLETQYTNPRDISPTLASRSGVDVGAARKTVSMPSDAASQGPAMSGGRSGTMTPPMPASRIALAALGSPMRISGLRYVMSATGGASRPPRRDELARQIDRLGEAEAATGRSASGLGGVADDGAVGERVGVRHAELDDVGTRLGERRGARRATLRGRVAGHQVGDERGPAVGERAAEPRTGASVNAESRLAHDVDVLVAAAGHGHDHDGRPGRAPRRDAAAARARATTRWPG